MVQAPHVQPAAIRQGSPIRLQEVRTRLRRSWPGAVLAVMLLPLTACAGFFQCDKASCPASTTGSTGTATTGDFAYVANSAAGSTSLSGYNVAAGTLVSLGSFSLGYIPVALSVAPSNASLYVASVPGIASPGIYQYAISSTGSLTVTNSGSPLVTDTVASMDISPDGNWLYTINSNGAVLSQYKVNATTGALTLDTQLTLPLSTCTLTGTAPVSQTCTVKVAPSGAYVVASLGAAGGAVFAYTSTAGITGANFSTVPALSTSSGDFSVALDANNYAYVAQTSSMTVYNVASSAITDEGTVSYASGTVPRGVTVSRNNQFVYTANEGTGTISGFGISGAGVLNALTGSPFTGPANVSALGVDNTGSYLVAVGYDGTAGIRLYSLAASGVLSQLAATGSGTTTTYPALLAMTH